MALIDKASLLMVPSTYEAGTLYNVLPSGNRAPDSTDQNSGYDQTRADFTFDRGSNAAATRVNADGLIEKYRENLLTYSNDFSQWTKSGTTTTSGQSGYDGSSDAWLITKSGGAFDQILRNVSSTGVNTISFYAKAGTLSSVYFRGQASSSIPDVKFNLSDGSLTSSNNIIEASSDDIGSGWYRLKMTFSNTITNVTIYPDFGQTTAGTIYIQNAQAETSMVATDYLDSGATTAKAGVLIDLPRINYDANGENGALLLEPQRLNSVENSEYFNGTDWSKGNITIESNSIISPDGLLNASKLIENTANDRHSLTKSFSTSATNNTISAFFKKGTRRYASIVTSDTTYWNTMVVVDLEDGSITKEYNRSGITSTNSVEDYGNGWYRLITSVNGAPSGSTLYARFTIQDSATPSNPPSNSYQGDGVSGIYIWGAQVENNASYATSYIPNHGESGGVTRAADSCYADNIGQTTAYTIFLDYGDLEQAESNFQDYISFQASGSNQNGLRAEGVGSAWRLYGYGISGSVTFPIAGSINKKKKAIVVSTAGIKLFEDGALTTQDLSGMTIPALGAITTKRGTSAPYPVEIKNSFKQIAVFNEALSDAECVTLTTL